MGFFDMLAPLADLAPYHLLIYGTLLGTELYQSFVMTKLCYQALPMSAFTNLQKRVFPVYFTGQSLLVLVTAATVPPYGPASLIQEKSDWIPLAIAGATAVLNWTSAGPKTKQAMIDRIHQETRDGKKCHDPDVSEEMQNKNRVFSKNHAMSIHLNAITIVATLLYGFRLGSRFQIGAN